LKIIGHKIYVYVFAIQSMLCTDYELFDMFYNEIQFFAHTDCLRQWLSGVTDQTLVVDLRVDEAGGNRDFRE
jgi:hypothetical protein